jgi:hypothetical protein
MVFELTKLDIGVLEFPRLFKYYRDVKIKVSEKE